jgi:hypothetical protein
MRLYLTIDKDGGGALNYTYRQINNPIKSGDVQ